MRSLVEDLSDGVRLIQLMVGHHYCQVSVTYVFYAATGDHG